MIRRILVAIDGSPHGDAAAGLGIEWAGRFGAELVGLGILDEPGILRPEPMPPGVSAYKRHRDRALLEDAHHRILEFLATFRRRCEGAGVRYTVLEDVGQPYEQIVQEAQGCDVVLVGRETHFHFETENGRDETLGRVLHLSPRPVVVVPREPAPGEGVLVAYGEGREIARTLQTVVLLGLAGGESIDVLAIDREPGKAEARLQGPGAFLAAHEVPYRLAPLASAEAPATVILEEVRRRRPRLLVIGAHGRHPFRSLFRTSVTRAVLEATPVPVIAGG